MNRFSKLSKKKEKKDEKEAHTLLQVSVLYDESKGKGRDIVDRVRNALIFHAACLSLGLNLNLKCYSFSSFVRSFGLI